MTEHDSSWMVVTSLKQTLEGAIIFNLMYCRALDDLRCALRNEGLLSVFEYYPDAAP